MIEHVLRPFSWEKGVNLIAKYLMEVGTVADKR